MISIIVVSLNTADKFNNTIKSILKQTYKNYELIVVDGDSKDETKNYIKKYYRYFDKIIIEKDNGIYDAMNKGIKKASKKWIYFLNSGDIFYNNKILEHIVLKLKNNDNNDVIIGNSYVLKDKLKFKSKRKKLSILSLGSSFSHQAAFVKTKLMKKELFKLKYKYAADFNFFFKILNENYKFKYIAQNISLNLSDGISDTNKVKVIKEFRNITLKYNSTLSKRIIYNTYIFYFYLTNILKKIIPNRIIYKIIKIKNN